MEAALRSASHDARLLSNRLERALGKGAGGPLSVNAARVATTSLLAEGATKGDLDADDMLVRLSGTSTLSSDDASKRISSGGGKGTAMDVDADDAERLVFAGEGGSGSVAARDNASTGQAAAPALPTEGNHAGPLSIGSIVAISAQAATPAFEESRVAVAVVAVDRSRLIAMLAAEERLCAMANHLGSAESIDTSSWLSPKKPSKSQRKSRVLPFAPPASASTSPATQEATRRTAATTLHNATAGFPHSNDVNTVGGFPHSNVVVAAGGRGKAGKRRAKSAEDYPPLAHSRVSPTWGASSSGGSGLPGGGSSVTAGWGSGRNKRSRGSKGGGDEPESEVGEGRGGRYSYEVAGLGGSTL
ncbi:unnamed protein product [Laminaria digitata]